MTLNIILLIVSFVLLYYGAKWLIVGASAIATSLNISKVVIGITLVAFGTSAPELFVNLIAAYRGHSGIALSNISGSNLANICIAYGFCVFFGKLIIDKKEFGLDFIYFCAAPLIILFFLLIYPGGSVPLWGAVIFIVLMILYIMSIKNRLYEESEQIEKPVNNTLKGTLIFLAGVTALYFSGEMIIYSATKISTALGISETVIALTVIALGTSLPEITASLVAVRRGETAIAAGNVIGSNIFNVFLVLGGSLIASRGALVADKIITIDYAVVSVLSIFLVITLLVQPKIGRLRASLLIGVYCAYMLTRVLFLN
ncbi:MAG: calcium/sodium antiporter [Sedimentisphaerales bacterium]|nr:calcium/sodium antiporter [Sedimentisphaerales bacterium]